MKTIKSQTAAFTKKQTKPHTSKKISKLIAIQFPKSKGYPFVCQIRGRQRKKKHTFFLGTAMSSMDPPTNGRHGKPSPAPLLSELEIWSDSGKTHCGDLVVGLNRPSVGDGIAIE